MAARLALQEPRGQLGPLGAWVPLVRRVWLVRLGQTEALVQMAPQEPQASKERLVRLEPMEARAQMAR